MQTFRLAVLNALRMSMLINAQNPLRLPVSLLALVAMSTTAWMASTVDLLFLNPSWFSQRPFSPTKRAWSRCRINSSRSFPVVSNRHIGLYDEATPRGLLPFLSRTNLCFFQSTKNLPSRRQELRDSACWSVLTYEKTPEKTEALLVTDMRSFQYPRAVLGEHEVEWKTRIKYLGVQLDRRLSFG